jgi:capsular exopolysaccharide synthesis family protein
MSRFFDALKHANLSELTDVDVPVHVGVKHVGSNAAQVTPGTTAAEFVDGIAAAFTGTTEATLSTSNGMSTSNGATPTADPWDLSAAAQGRREIVQAAKSTALARAAVDQNVRMIPNAIDRAVVEHYRRLRTKVMQHHGVKPFRSLLITSASPQEGKSVTVLNLALSFAMLPSFRVVVVDGDLRRNTIGKWLGAADRPGFSNLLDRSASLQDVIFTCEDSNIHLIPGGTSTAPPAELLHAGALADAVRDLTAHFDLVLFDSPPLTLVTDAHLIAAQTEAVLLVARAFKSTKKSLEKAVQDLLPFRVIGTVLNGGPRATLYRGYGGYY